jgi:seryl-tRNA synthetase
MGHLIKNGFYPVLPPVLVREPAMFGTGFFPADKNEYYHVNPGEDDLYLVGTSEVPLTAYHRDDLLDLATPVKYVGYSPCFRREAGSYGKDLKGILRGHQFDKLEMVCFTKPEESKAMHDHMVQMEIDIWKGLGIPFRKVNCCSGDLGGAASIKRYDLEAWIPSENTYREVTSCSNIADFQCRRLNTKFIDAEGNRQLAHSLNGTVIAFSRCLIALVENFQTAEGDVIIPEVLRAYMGGREKV